MKKKSTTIVFFGNERLATGVSTTAPTLRALVENGYSVGALVANFEAGRSRNARDLEIASVAKAYHIPLLLPDTPGAVIADLKQINADIGILVAYGKIVPESVIKLFPKGIINIHPSLLPLHRGPTPIESAILGGERETGVSIMQLERAMDAGPVFGQSVMRVSGHETKQSLANSLLETGAAMLVSLLPDIINGRVVALPQDESRATYDSLLTKDAGIIDWLKPAEQIEREIRAYQRWPKSRTIIAGKDVIISKAHVAGIDYYLDLPHPPPAFETPDGLIGIPSLTKGVLVIDRLQPAGKNEMTAAEFLAGHRHLLN